MDNKKNTILLTVIAVATLLVAVVGATFAYFTAQGGTNATSKVTVTTGTAASSEFASFGDLSIYADATTFTQTLGTAEGEKSHTATTTGTVKWTAPGDAVGVAEANKLTEAEREFCYTATLNVTENDFVKSAANADSKIELEFIATRNSTTLVTTKLEDTGTAGVRIPTEAGGSKYQFRLVPNAGESITDTWNLTVNLVNYDFNQNDNAGKSFTGNIVFEKVTCAEGSY